jgi:hypothetical protein
MKKALGYLLHKKSALLLFLCAVLYSPTSFAEAASKDSIQGYIIAIIRFINTTIIPVLFGLALLFFLVNAARYFILKGADAEGQEKARSLALYGIGAFVALLSLWGIVNLLVEDLGFDRERPITPDYIDTYRS